MLRFGHISSVNIQNGTARVNFDDDQVVSQELPILNRKTLNDKYSFYFDVGEHVVVLMDEYLENGVILGAIYSKTDQPALVSSQKISGVVFEDGSYIKYDSQNKIFDLKTGVANYKISNTGHSIKKENESLKNILLDILTGIKAITHTETGSTTGPPLNIAAFTAIETKINNLFEG